MKRSQEIRHRDTEREKERENREQCTAQLRIKCNKILLLEHISQNNMSSGALQL